MDLQGSIPTFVLISDGKLHDAKVLDGLPPEPGAIYLTDRAYIDFVRLFRLQTAGAFFVVRAKSNLLWRRRYARPVDKQLNLRCDQTIVLTGSQTATKSPHPLRRVGLRDTDQQRSFHFLTNNFELPARTVADLYRHRWKIEFLFRVLKTGARIEDRRLREADALVRCFAFDAVTAWRVFSLQWYARDEPDTPAAEVLSDDEREVIGLLVRAERPLPPGEPGQPFPPDICSRVVPLPEEVGWHPSKRQPLPGNELLWRACVQLQMMVRVTQAAHAP